jgi:hypothetical protein
MNKGKTPVEEIKVPTVYLDNVPITVPILLKVTPLSLKKARAHLNGREQKIC